MNTQLLELEGYIDEALIELEEIENELGALGHKGFRLERAKKNARKLKKKQLEPGVYLNKKQVKIGGVVPTPFRHEYVVAIPKQNKLSKIPSNMRKDIKRVGPNGEKGVVLTGAATDKKGVKTETSLKPATLEPTANFDPDLEHAKKTLNKKGKRVARGQTKAVRAYEATKKAEVKKRKYPTPLRNALGKQQNSNTVARHIVRESGGRQPKRSWREPGSKLALT